MYPGMLLPLVCVVLCCITPSQQQTQGFQLDPADYSSNTGGFAFFLLIVAPGVTGDGNWYRNNVAVSPVPNKIIITTSGDVRQIVIRSIVAADAGTYTFRVNNFEVSAVLSVDVDGGLTQWTQWSGLTCTRTCGLSETGTVVRNRSCTNQAPQNGGNNCTGSTFEAQTRNCGFSACPIAPWPILTVDGGVTPWSQWTLPTCSATCGEDANRVATRFRTCTDPRPSDGGKDCTEVLSETTSRTCGFGPCPIDGGVTQWAQWSDPGCSVTCGTSATKTLARTRSCINPTPQFGGRDCTETLSETTVRNCGLQSCAVNGGISQWTSWVVPQCLFTCGVTKIVIATRQRFCNSPPPRNGGLNCTETRVDSQVRSCDLPSCPIDGGISQWTQWSMTPCGVTCGINVQRTASRQRFCNNPFPSFGGQNCYESRFQNETRNCGLNPCPIDGGVSQWTSWTGPPCGVTCGTTATWTITRVRFCNNPFPQNGGRNCTQSRTESLVRNCRLPTCPVDGGLTQWSQWAVPTCPFTCGTSITRTASRTRSCTNPIPQNGGRNCIGNRFETETRSCNLAACPIDGGVSQWTSWTGPPCGVTCGTTATWTITRVRFCNNPFPQNGGRNCTQSLTESLVRNCGLPTCPVDGGLTQWSQWALPTCPFTCGTSITRTASRTRSCTNPIPQNGGRNCIGNRFETETRSCNLAACPIDGYVTAWTEWTGAACILTCGTSATHVVTRTRTCTNPPPSSGGPGCSEILFQSTTRSCGLPECPGEDGMALWTEWAGEPCVLTVSRTRTCTKPTPTTAGQGCSGDLFQTTTRRCSPTDCKSGIGAWTWIVKPGLLAVLRPSR